MHKYLFLSAAIFLIGATISACSSIRGSSTSIPDQVDDAPLASTKGEETAVLAGGSTETARYEKVGTGATGHAESVKISYDPAQISYGQLLKVFFSVAHDPTELNRQGPDTGTQYRSAIFYANDEQKRIA